MTACLCILHIVLYNMYLEYALPFSYRVPRLGVSTTNNNNTYLFEDDPGIMSEIETSSTRLTRKPHRGHGGSSSNRPPPAASSGAATRMPRTSPKTSSTLYDEDPGIMSEAETASTTRGKRTSSRNNSIPSMGYKGAPNNQRSVQFRYPVAQFQLPSTGSTANLFDEDPGIMSEADTSSTSSRKRRQLKAEALSNNDDVKQRHHTSLKDNLPIVRRVTHVQFIRADPKIEF